MSSSGSEETSGKPLTSAVEDYQGAIFELDRNSQKVHVKDIAKRLDVK
jgi:Mn-dependent DtxR family transcriptional regulator